MRPERFWSSLESLPGLAATSAEWHALLGDEYAAVAGFLRPTQKLATSCRALVPGRHCIHRIVDHGDGEYVAVCEAGCPPRTLSKSDCIVYEVDVLALSRAVAEALNLRDAAVRLERVPGTVRIGRSMPYAGFRFPVYLSVHVDAAEFRQAVDTLLAASAEPFLLLAPTPALFHPDSEDRLAHRQSCFLALSEILALERDGRFALADGLTAESIMGPFHQMNVPQAEDESGAIFFPTPPGATWEQLRVRFVDNHTVSVSVGNASVVCHYSQMGMTDGRNANPTKQWELLHTFAEGNGIVDWSHRKADRKNQKRRETLAKNLQAFFRIDGEPFVAEGNGWRARFDIALGT